MYKLHKDTIKITGKYNTSYEDELISDQLDFENELDNLDKINKKYLDFEPTEKLVVDDHITGYSGGFNRLVQYNENTSTNYIVDISSNELEHNIMILRNFDVLQTIYLEITLNDLSLTFDTLPNYIKRQLFNTQFKFNISGNSVMSGTILANIFLLFCKDINIKTDTNTIQIPIIDFNLNSLGNYDDNGYPMIMASLTEQILNLKFTSDELFKFMTFKVILCGRLLLCRIRKPLCYSTEVSEYLYLFSKTFLCDSLDTNKIITGYADVKALIITFDPLDDNYIDYPKIESVEIYLIGNKTTYYCDYEDLLFMEVCGDCYTIVPLAEDFSSWKNIANTLKYPEKYLSADSLRGGCIKVQINYDYRPDNFQLNCTTIFPNILRFLNGACEQKYVLNI